MDFLKDLQTDILDTRLYLRKAGLHVTKFKLSENHFGST
jgi:hypothetical protein